MTEPHVLAIGEAVMDIIERDGMPPLEIPGGAPANFALAMARLGRSSYLHTWLADDQRGHVIANHLEQAGVHLTKASWGANHTSTAHVTLRPDGRADYEFDFEWAPPQIKPSPCAQIVHAGSIATLMEPGAKAVRALMETARDHALVTFMPNVRPSFIGETPVFNMGITPMLAAADVIAVSIEDLDWIRGSASRETVIDIWRNMGTGLVIVIDLRVAVHAYTAKGPGVTLPVVDVDVQDTIGVTDAFLAGVIDRMWEMGLRGPDARTELQRLQRDELLSMLHRGLHASAYTATKVGADPPTRAALESFDHVCDALG